MNQPSVRYKTDLFDDFDPSLIPDRTEDVPAGNERPDDCNLPPMRPGALIDLDRFEDLFDI